MFIAFVIEFGSDKIAKNQMKLRARLQYLLILNNEKAQSFTRWW